MALLGPVFFQGASATVEILQPAHSAIRDAVSTLVFGPYGWLQTAAFYVFGVSLILLAGGLVARVRTRFNAGALAVALTGIGFVILGANQTHIAGTALSVASTVHLYTSVAVIFTSPLACFLVIPALKGDGHAAFRIYSIAAGAFAILFVTIGGQLLVAGSSLVGLYERVLLWNGQVWAEVIGARLIWDMVKNRAQSPVTVTGPQGEPTRPGQAR
jgi:hypothetical protein